MDLCGHCGQSRELSTMVCMPEGGHVPLIGSITLNSGGPIRWVSLEYKPCQNGHAWVWASASTGEDPPFPWMRCECGKYRWDDFGKKELLK